MKRNEVGTEVENAAMPRRDALRRVGAGGLAAGLMLGLGSSEANAQSTLTSAATEAAARRAINAINQVLAGGDMSLLDFAFAPDYVNHTPGSSPQTGQPYSPDLAGLEAALTDLRTLSPNAVILVEDVVASVDTAAILGTFRGTVDPAPIGLPTGASNRLSIGGLAYGRVADGRVTESWNYHEAAQVLAALTQATPTPTPPPPPTPTPEAAALPATPGEVREVRDFHELEVQGTGTVLLRQGDVESLTIEAEEKVLNRIGSEVRRGRLTISPLRSFNTKEPITYYLTARRLTYIALSGSTRLEADAFTADQLQMSLEGTASVAIANLTANVLDVEAKGSGRIDLGGTVDQQTVNIDGTVTYNAADLASRQAAVSVGGTAQATVNVSESLNAAASGTGRVMYVGNPEVQEQTSGVGSVEKVG
jgi:hypothetical protein